LFYLAIATVVTGAIAIAGKDFFEKLFYLPGYLAAGFLITGIMLLISGKFMQGKRKDINFKDSLALGIMQAAAIVPSISRSATTVCSLLFRGLDREMSFRFSFIAAIPAILGAALLEARKIKHVGSLDLSGLAAGFIFSLIAGILSLWFLRFVIRKAKLHYFGYYCIIVAVAVYIFLK
jgi:undecaprenyl-diphosphatase